MCWRSAHGEIKGCAGRNYSRPRKLDHLISSLEATSCTGKGVSKGGQSGLALVHAALLIFLAAPAGARVVPADRFVGAEEWDGLSFEHFAPRSGRRSLRRQGRLCRCLEEG